MSPKKCTLALKKECMREKIALLGKIWFLWCWLLSDPSPLVAKAVPRQYSTAPAAARSSTPRPQQPQAARWAVCLLALIAPPAAVVVWQDGIVTKWFWWAFVLTLLGFVPGILYALFILTR